MMDIAKFFRACRVGDIEAVRNLLPRINVNIRDRWDSTPLYYACLCGHVNIVQFLLENGALCDANTFDGERCIFGALTDEIRNILVRDYKVISRKVAQRQDYDEFLRKAFQFGTFSDITFSVHKVQFKAHKCVLAARCRYFEDMLTDKWKGRQVIVLNHPLVDASAFKVLLHYLYTGILEFHLSLKDQLLRLLRQCKLTSELILIEEQFSKLTGRTKHKLKHSNILLEYPASNDFHRLYQSSLPIGLSAQPSPAFAEGKVSSSATGDLFKYRDIVFKVEGCHFHCHKLFFAMQSDYFLALIEDHFYESRESLQGAKVYELTDISLEAFDALLCYLYSNFTLLSIDCAFELIMQADVYLMNSLKRFCANFIGNHVSQLNAIDLIKLSRMLSLPKLEKTAIEHIAHNLEQFVVANEAFQELILSDAHEIKERQETDTIDIIDDIRYYLSNSNRKDIASKLAAIDILLESLNLRA